MLYLLLKTYYFGDSWVFWSAKTYYTTKEILHSNNIMINVCVHLKQLHGHFIDISGGICSLKQDQVQEHHCVKLIIPATDKSTYSKYTPFWKHVCTVMQPDMKPDRHADRCTDRHTGSVSCTCCERRWQLLGNSRSQPCAILCSSDPLPRTSDYSDLGSALTAASLPHNPTDAPAHANTHETYF